MWKFQGIVFYLFSGALLAQSTPLSFSLGGTLTLAPLEVNESSLRSLASFSEDGNNEATNLLTPETEEISLGAFGVQLGAQYELRPWLTASMQILYGAPLDISSGSSIDEALLPEEKYPNQRVTRQSSGISSFFEIAPKINFDLSWKEPYEAFHIRVGPTLGWLYYREVELVKGDLSILEASHQQKDVTRIFNFVRLDLGIEWRDYITRHLGYFLSADISAPFTVSVSKIEVDTYRINGEAQPLEGQKIDPDDFGGGGEDIDIYYLNFGLGLTYKLD